MKVLSIQKNYIYTTNTKTKTEKSTKTNSPINFYASDIIDINEKPLSDKNIELSIDKSMFHNIISGLYLNKPLIIKIDKDVFSGEQNGNSFDFKGTEAYGGFRKSYEGIINGKKFSIKHTNPWGTSNLYGSYDGNPVHLDIKVTPERNIIKGNLGDHTIDISIISCMHKYKTVGLIDDKKVDLSISRNRVTGEYDIDNELLPFVYALYNDRLLQEPKF